MIERLKTLIIPSTVLIRAVVATMILQNLVEATKSPKRDLGRNLMIAVAILKQPTFQRPNNNRESSSKFGNNGERQQSQKDRNDDGQQRNRSSNQNCQDYSNNLNSNQNRNQFCNNSNYVNRHYNNNGMSNSNSNFQCGQGYNSRGNQNFEEFNPDSSYRTNQKLDHSSSRNSKLPKFQLEPARVYTNYSELGEDESSGSARLEFIQRTREPAGPNVFY